MKPAPEVPADLDFQAKRKWYELIGAYAPDADLETIGNYCRQFSRLVSIRRDIRRLQKSGKFRSMAPGRDGTQTLHPLLTGEARLIASMNRMLKSLELVSSASSRDRQGRAQPPGSDQAMINIERMLCGPNSEPSADVREANRRRAANQKLLEAGDWRNYEENFDGGK